MRLFSKVLPSFPLVGGKLLLSLAVVHVSPAISAANDLDASQKLLEHTQGAWSEVIDWPFIGIHSILTPQGEVFTFGTNNRSAEENGRDSDGNILEWQGAQYYYDMWSPITGEHDVIEHTLNNVDSFCSGPILLPESNKIIMPGGDARLLDRPEFLPGDDERINDPIYQNAGIVDAPVFDIDTQVVDAGKSMNSARWYPTSTILDNGEVLVSGGIDGKFNSVFTPEVFTPDQDSWRYLMGATDPLVFDQPRGGGWYYPRQWLAPNGLVFGLAGNIAYYLDYRNLGNVEIVDTIIGLPRNYYSTSVMYQPGKILTLGGDEYLPVEAKTIASKAAYVVDINSDTPEFTTVESMEHPRVWPDSTVLPDGTVFVNGGSSKDNVFIDVILTPELWDPKTNTWRSLADAKLPRLYHSTSLLLPDGRILVAGGGAPKPEPPRGPDGEPTGPGGENNINAEIFSPPYLFDDNDQLKDRIEIVSASKNANHGDVLTVTFEGQQAVSRVTLVKTGAVTHSFNMEQRFMELEFNSAGAGKLTTTLPASAFEMPPGHYMLFLVDAEGTPSVGHIVSISVPEIEQPKRSISKTYDTLFAGQVLFIGDEPRVSANGVYRLHLQSDGNFVVYDHDGDALWSAATFNKNVEKVAFQEDGQLLAYAFGEGDRNGPTQWRATNQNGDGDPTGTFGLGGRHLIMQNDGRLVMRDINGELIWANTNSVIDTSNNRLESGQFLVPSSAAERSELKSKNGEYRFVFQADGNAVIYNKEDKGVWSTKTHSLGGTRLLLQSDGHLVMYNDESVAVWQSGTFGQGAVTLIMGNDGTLALIDNQGNRVWATPIPEE